MRHNKRIRPRRGRGVRNRIGWDYVHVAVDDCTRLAYAEVLDDEKAITVVAFLKRAVAFSLATASRSSGSSLTDESQAAGAVLWWDPLWWCG